MLESVSLLPVSPLVDKTAPVWRFDYRFSSAAAWFISDGEKPPPFKRGRKGPCGTLLSRSSAIVHYSTPPNFYLWNRKTSRAKIMVFFAFSSSKAKSTETLGVVWKKVTKTPVFYERRHSRWKYPSPYSFCSCSKKHCVGVACAFAAGAC